MQLFLCNPLKDCDIEHKNANNFVIKTKWQIKGQLTSKPIEYFWFIDFNNLEIRNLINSANNLISG